MAWPPARGAVGSVVACRGVRASALLFGLAALLLAACSSPSGFDRGAMKSALRAGNPFFTTSHPARAGAPEPKTALPLAIAVSQPLGTASGWNAEEISEIQSWVIPLSNAGVANSVVVIPASLVSADCSRIGGSCDVGQYQAAAARLGADALLTVTQASSVDAYSNRKSLLDFTIIGMWTADAHHRDALTMLEGVLADNRSDHVYVTAQAEAEVRQTRPLMYIDAVQLARDARLAALRELGRELVAQVARLRASAS